MDRSGAGQRTGRFVPVPGRLDAERVERSYAAGYWRDEVVGDLLARQAAERPDAVAIVEGDRRTTWSELHRLSRRLALQLRELGVAPGDAVALQLPNWLEYVVCYHAIQLAGAVVVQPGVDWRAVETAHGLALGPAKAVIVPAAFAGHDFPEMIAGLRPRLPALEHVLVARGEAPPECVSLDRLLADPIERRVDPAVLDACRPGPDEVVRVVFTSGTTGLPKAILHTSNTIAHSSRTLQAAFGHGPDDVFLAYVPFSTNYGVIMGLHLPVTAGARTVLADRFSARGSLELIERERVTFLPGTPTGLIALVHSPARAARRVDSLRLVIAAGASFPVAAIKELRQAFPATFIESYGMNEFGMGFWCGPDDDPDAVDGSIGRPIPGLEARVVDAAGRAVARGEIGELVVRSAGMCAGYLDNPEANAAAWDAGGWFHSGDLVTVDAHGNYRVVGRSKEVIIRGGANVSPREVEEALGTHPGIREACVIGLPDPHYGEVVCACVIPAPGARPSLEDVRAHLERRIAAYKIPSRLVRLDAFPLNSMGKVRKAALRDRVLAQDGSSEAKGRLRPRGEGGAS